MTKQVSAETLEALKKVWASGDLNKATAWTQSGTATSGLTMYQLDPVIGHLYPVLTPLRDEIPRVVGGQGIQANWRAITGVNTGNAGIGISEGNRGVVLQHTTADYTAAFKGIGYEDYVTFEGDWAAEGFTDLKAQAVTSLLMATMIGEEQVILGGDNSVALGTTPTPTCADVTTGGTLAPNTTYNVVCIALTLDGFQNSSVSAGLPLSATRTLADGTTEAYNQGTAQQSANATASTANDSNSTHCVSATVAAVAGAYAYAWFLGTSSSNQKLNQITTINSAKLTAASAGGAQLATAGFASDLSQNAKVFDGLLTQAIKSGSGAYVATLATGTAGTGTTLTADGAGGIVEIDALLKDRWDNYRLSPDTMWVSSQEQTNINKKALSGTSTGAQRFVFNTNQQGIIVGSSARAYTNKYSMNGATEIEIKLHPNMPAGTILFTSKRIPYKLPNVATPVRMLLRRDYYQIEYPLRTRKYEYGVYADGVLQHYFPPTMGVITNIANG